MCLIEPRTKQNSLYFENPLDKAFPVESGAIQNSFDTNWTYQEVDETDHDALELSIREVWGGK